MSIYHDPIARRIRAAGLNPGLIPPEWVEELMRGSFSALDGLSSARFSAECDACIEELSAASPEELRAAGFDAPFVDEAGAEWPY